MQENTTFVLAKKTVCMRFDSSNAKLLGFPNVSLNNVGLLV